MLRAQARSFLLAGHRCRFRSGNHYPDVFLCKQKNIMQIQKALQILLDKQDLSADQMRAVMRLIMSGGATDAQIGGFLIALRCKGESIDEIAAAANHA